MTRDASGVKLAFVLPRPSQAVHKMRAQFAPVNMLYLLQGRSVLFATDRYRSTRHRATYA